MLAWLAPELARKCAHALTRASSAQARGLRGASIILNGEAESSSGPHKDSEPTLLLALSGARRVWWALTINYGDPLLTLGGYRRSGFM